jgi:2-octaprenyl-6-methoxyphenol hydroxylase
MTIRDIKILSEIIDDKINLGMQIDSSIFVDFEKQTKSKNFLFSNSIDFIYEAFNFDTKIRTKSFNKIIKVIGKSKSITSYLIKFADKGLNF